MKTKKSRMIITIAIIMFALAIFVAGILLLPDTVVMQISTGGKTGTTMPKPIGLLIPLAITIIFGVMYAKEGSGKSLILSAVGVLLNLLTFVYNYWFIG